ncbi:MAG TPA: DUF58 domain-containing protein [Methylophilaceae bacterium]|jgi:uncharacterized protein (DUF58 family)
MARALKLPNWSRWLRTTRAAHADALLDRRHIYILPTRAGWFFGFVLLLMLAGSINYTLSLGFVLVFLLTGMAIVCMLHTWRNLAHLQARAGRADPVYAGETARFDIVLTDADGRTRHAVCARFDPAQDDTANPTCIDIPAGGSATATLSIRSRRRGWLQAGRIRLYTEFPLGLFHVWGYVELNNRCLVYPRPADSHIPFPSATDRRNQGGADTVAGDDDFFGHRSYQPGDSPRRIDWKASARKQGILTKQFQGAAQSALWFDWAATPGNDDEQRISRLTRWILDAAALDRNYGLRLPNHEFAPDSGPSHMQQCLQALALL